MSVDSLKEQARRHERDEEWRKALDLYLKAINRLDGADEPDVSIFNRAGDLHVRLGAVDEALKLYDRAIDLYLEADLPNNAIAICRKVGRHVPERAEIFLRMGQIRALQGFSVDARQNYLTYAEILQTRGEMDAALDALKELVQRIPEDWESRILLAEGLLKRDQSEEAVSQLQAAWAHLMQEGSDLERADALRGRILELDPDVVLEASLSAPSPTDATVADEGVEGFESTGLDPLDGFDSVWRPDTELDVEVEEGELTSPAEPRESADAPMEAVTGQEVDFQEILPDVGEALGPEEQVGDQISEPRLESTVREEEEVLEEDLPMMEVPGLEAAGPTFDADDPADPVPVDETTPFGEQGVGVHRREVDEAYRTEDRERLLGALLDLAEALAREGDLEAETVFGQLLQLDPGNPRALAALGRSSPFDGPLAADSPQEADPDEAPDELGEISEMAWMDVEIPEPEEAPAENGDPGVAGSLQEVGLSGAGEGTEYVDLGSMIFDESPGEKSTRWTVAAEEPSGDEGVDFAKMLSQFKDKVAENLEGEDARSQYDLGTAYKEMGLLDEAISMFQKALRMEPAYLAAIEMLGQCFLDRREPQVAIQVLRRGVVDRSQGPEDDLVGIYYFLGQAHEAAGNPEEAREFYERVFALDINFRDVTDRLRALR